MNLLSIDIGGTFIKYAILDDDLSILKHWMKPTKKLKDKNEFYDYVCEDLDMENIRFVGVSAPGVIDAKATVISKAATNVQAMYLSNVNVEINNRLNVPVQTINDGKSAGYCEMKIGNGKDSKSSAYFIIGTGIGGCLCLGEQLIEGVDRIAGEFSNLPVGFYKDKPSKIIGLSKIASMTALVESYNQKANTQFMLGKVIIDRYLQGEELAKEVLDDWCKNIVMGLYMIVVMYNPEIICIGGGISEEDWFIKKIKDVFYNKVQSISEPTIHTKIQRCKFNSNANLLGAALYAKDTLTLA